MNMNNDITMKRSLISQFMETKIDLEIGNHEIIIHELMALTPPLALPQIGHSIMDFYQATLPSK